jgi:hypothetical protein
LKTKRIGDGVSKFRGFTVERLECKNPSFPVVSGYQLGGVNPSVGGKLYMACNEWVRRIFEKLLLDTCGKMTLHGWVLTAPSFLSRATRETNNA